MEGKEEKKEVKEETVEVEIDPENVTREINLDDLYDGAVNNTVVIDPITNNEILLKNKKPNYTILGIIIAVIILLVLYYVNNKTVLGNTTKEVEAKTTKKIQTTTASNDSGVLTCLYTSKSDAETQNVTYTVNYSAGKVVNSEFSFVVVSNVDGTSAVIDDLKSQYEDFFLNNSNIKGNVITFEKNSKGFTFDIKTNYKTSGYNMLTIKEGQTILLVKPEETDTTASLQKAYTDKGFNCTIGKDNENE